LRTFSSWSLILIAIACGSDASHPAALAAASSAEVGIVPQTSKVVGHDGGRSAMLFGHSVWIYGDTFLSVADTRGRSFHSNSFAWTDDLDASNGVGEFQERLDAAGAPTPFFPSTDEEAAYNELHAADGARWAIWPLAIVDDHARSRALVFYELIDAKPGAWNFHGVGRGVALWTDFATTPERPIASPGALHPTLLFAENEPLYGEEAVIDGEILYTFACKSGGLDLASCTLARVAPDKVSDRGAWAFWDGAAWTSESRSARAVLSAGSGLAVFRRQDTWVATYTRPLGNEVVARTARALTGPWSDETQLFVADRRGADGWTYDAFPHPEVGQAPLYFSFTRPTGLFSSETALVRVDVK
jgi:hypothetical protein